MIFKRKDWITSVTGLLLYTITLNNCSRAIPTQSLSHRQHRTNANDRLSTTSTNHHHSSDETLDCRVHLFPRIDQCTVIFKQLYKSYSDKALVDRILMESKVCDLYGETLQCLHLLYLKCTPDTIHLNFMEDSLPHPTHMQQLCFAKNHQEAAKQKEHMQREKNENLQRDLVTSDLQLQVSRNRISKSSSNTIRETLIRTSPLPHMDDISNITNENLSHTDAMDNSNSVTLIATKDTKDTAKLLVPHRVRKSTAPDLVQTTTSSTKDPVYKIGNSLRIQVHKPRQTKSSNSVKTTQKPLHRPGNKKQNAHRKRKRKNGREYLDLTKDRNNAGITENEHGYSFQQSSQNSLDNRKSKDTFDIKTGNLPSIQPTGSVNIPDSHHETNSGGIVIAASSLVFVVSVLDITVWLL